MQAVYLQMGGLRLPQPPRFFKLCKKTSSIILPAKTEPIWTGSEPVIKTLCLQMGGGGCAPPPNPPAFVLRRAGQEHPTMNKNWFKHRPATILITDVCSSHGEALAAPPLSFYAVQAFFQEHCIINNTCFAHIIVIDLFKHHRAGSLFANGGATSPPTPVLF